MALRTKASTDSLHVIAASFNCCQFSSSVGIKRSIRSQACI